MGSLCRSVPEVCIETLSPTLQVAWRGLGGAGGAPRWRLSMPLSLRTLADSEAIFPMLVAADATATPNGLRLLLTTVDDGAGGRRHLRVVTVKGDPTALPPGVHCQSLCHKTSTEKVGEWQSCGGTSTA